MATNEEGLFSFGVRWMQGGHDIGEVGYNALFEHSTAGLGFRCTQG